MQASCQAQGNLLGYKLKDIVSPGIYSPGGEMVYNYMMCVIIPVHPPGIRSPVREVVCNYVRCALTQYKLGAQRLPDGSASGRRKKRFCTVGFDVVQEAKRCLAGFGKVLTGLWRQKRKA